MKKTDYERLNKLIKSRGFKIYNEHLDKQIRQLMNNLMDIDGDANKVQFSRHDVYRMLIKILITYKQAPLKELSMVIAENQTNPEVANLLDDTKSFIRDIVYGSEGYA